MIPETASIKDRFTYTSLFGFISQHLTYFNRLIGLCTLNFTFTIRNNLVTQNRLTRLIIYELDKNMPVALKNRNPRPLFSAFYRCPDSFMPPYSVLLFYLIIQN